MNTVAAITRTPERARTGKPEPAAAIRSAAPAATAAPASLADSTIFRKASCACGGGCPACQAKSAGLNISQPNDPAEIEADQIADRVMRMPADKPVREGSLVQGKVSANGISTKRSRGFTPSKTGLSAPAASAQQKVPSSVGSVLASGGQPLAQDSREFFEDRFGLDFGHVRIFNDSDAIKSADQLNARAYTVGDNIVFGRGEFQPTVESGQRLIAHELAHTIQSRTDAQAGIRRMPKGVSSAAECGSNGEFGSVGVAIVKNKTEGGETAYEVDGIPTKDKNPKGTPHKVSGTAVFLKDGDEVHILKVASTPKYWTPICLKLEDRESAEIAWVRSSGLASKTVAPPASANSPTESDAGSIGANMTDAELESEVNRIRDWLIDNPEPGESRDYHQERLTKLEDQASARNQTASAGPKVGTAGKSAEFDSFKGADINATGMSSADAKNYKDAVQVGMRVRSRPDPDQKYEIGRVKYGTTIFIKAEDSAKKGWVFIVMPDGSAGWISRDFVAFPLPSFDSELHHVESEEMAKDLLWNHYQKKYTIKPGDDLRVLTAALYITNRDRGGVKKNDKKFQESLENNRMKNVVDPWNAENRAIFQSLELIAGMNIWLPGVSYINELKATGAIETRPAWMTEFIEAGKAVVGFTAGVFEGFFGAIIDALQGLWEMVKGIFETVGKIVSGEIWNDIEALYDSIKNLTWEDAKRLASELLSAIVKGAENFYDNWTHRDTYKKWNFRGIVVGNILLEVVLAIFTAGAANAAKWIGKLAKIAPKLAKFLMKILTKVDDVLPPKFKKSGKGHLDKDDSKIDVDKDQKGHSKQQALVMAKSITELHDQKDSSLGVLRISLAAVNKKYSAVKGFKIERVIGKPGHYRVWMIASKHLVDNDFTPKSTTLDEAALRGKWDQWTEEECDAFFELRSKKDDFDLSSNTPDHKAQRWQDYDNRDQDEKWEFDRWSKQYHVNMSNSRKIEREKFYLEKFAGKKPKAIKTPYTERHLDIQKGDKELFELKTGKEYLTTTGDLPNTERIKKDKWLRKQGYSITWILEDGGSGPLIKELKKAGIKVVDKDLKEIVLE